MIARTTVAAVTLLTSLGGSAMTDSHRPSEPRRNRLAAEHSPYLLQHADNPVDWYPWGEEAFATARRLDRPVFLSIGYSTCHWCHVMEHESFEDPVVATLLNETFVNVKVDREERPDVDQLYMTVCQMLTGSGGWPLTIMMTPDRRPFFAATYIPRDSRFGRAGMVDLIPQVARLWADERDRLLESAGQIVGHLETMAQRDARGQLDATAAAEAAVRGLRSRYDEVHGGFGSAPKFPSPHTLLFLLEEWRRSDDDRLPEMVEHTLDAMRRGGIFDQLGFGFHRYSTDREWLLPHFEKMLYDQAMHVLAAAEAADATGHARHGDTVRQVAEYVDRDLTAPGGAFYSAEDADSEGEEGRFYVWTRPELDRALGPENGSLAARLWNVTAEGNFADESTGRRTGANVLHQARPLAEIAADLEVEPAALATTLESIRSRLLEARAQRVRPLLDDTILADWNGLMVAALARAGHLLGDAKLVDAAAGAMDFVLAHLRDDNGRLLHRWRDGHAAVPAMLDDHAFCAWGALELYEATLEPRWLTAAIELTDAALTRYWDADRGGFHPAGAGAGDLLVRMKDATDGAIPSGNGVAATVLVRLARLTGRADLERRAAATVAAFAGDVARMPSGHTQLLSAARRAEGPSMEIVIVGGRDEPAAADLLTVVRDLAPRHASLLLVPSDDEGRAAVIAAAPFAAAFERIGGAPAAYVCRGFRCELPVTDPATLRDTLRAAETTTSR